MSRVLTANRHSLESRELESSQTNSITMGQTNSSSKIKHQSRIGSKYASVPTRDDAFDDLDDIDDETNAELSYSVTINASDHKSSNRNSNINIANDSDDDDDDAYSSGSRLILGTRTEEAKGLLPVLPTARKHLKHPWADKKLTWFNHFSVGAYWFGWAFVWMPLFIVIIPNQVQHIVGVGMKGTSMGTVFLFGSVGSLLLSPMFGHMSDCSQNVTGRRRPFLTVGVITTTVGLLLMATPEPPFWFYCMSFFIASFGNFITLAPYSALVPDVIPPDQRGICSGWLGACSMFGYLLGGAVSYHLAKLGFPLTYIFLAATHGFFAWITIRFVPEVPFTGGSAPSLHSNAANYRHKKFTPKHTLNISPANGNNVNSGVNTEMSKSENPPNHTSAVLADASQSRMKQKLKPKKRLRPDGSSSVEMSSTDPSPNIPPMTTLPGSKSSPTTTDTNHLITSAAKIFDGKAETPPGMMGVVKNLSAAVSASADKKNKRSDVDLPFSDDSDAELDLDAAERKQLRQLRRVDQTTCQKVFSFFHLCPFSNSDFNWLFVSRFFIQMGAIIVQENLQYYLKDTTTDYTILGVPLATDEVQAVSVLFAPLLFGALISSIVSGIVSDIYDQQRKFLVYFSGFLMSTCCFLFGINSYFSVDIVIALLFGFGFGIFSAIDWAMATDVLPNPKCYGRDMGLWNLAFTLPQILGAPLVGRIIDSFREWEHIHLGWFCVFGFSCLNFAIGTMLVRKIAHVK